MTTEQYQRMLQELRNKQRKSKSDEKTIKAIETLLHHRQKLEYDKSY